MAGNFPGALPDLMRLWKEASISFYLPLGEKRHFSEVFLSHGPQWIDKSTLGPISGKEMRCLSDQPGHPGLGRLRYSKGTWQFGKEQVFGGK